MYFTPDSDESFTITTTAGFEVSPPGIGTPYIRLSTDTTCDSTVIIVNVNTIYKIEYSKLQYNDIMYASVYIN